MYLLYITAFLLLLYVMVIFCCIVFPVKFSPRTIVCFWWIGIILMAVFVFYLDPINGWDLNLLYRWVDDFRFGYSKITDNIFIVQNLILWLVSKTNDNGWLVFLAVIFWGACVSGVIKEYIYNNKYNTQAILIGFLSAYSAHYIIYLVSGIRSALVTAMWVYAYYRWYKKSRGIYYGIMIAGMLIHLISPILMTLTFVYHLVRQKGKKWNYILVFAAIFVVGFFINNDFSELFLGFNNEYMQMIGMKWSLYTDYENQLRGEGFFRALTLVVYLVCVIYLHRKGNPKYDIIGFFILVAFAGNNMDILINRLPYALGIAAIPVINETVIVARSGKRELWLAAIGGPVVLKFMWGLSMLLKGANFKGGINFLELGDWIYDFMHMFV